jgi:hypothetical protein
MDNFLDSLNFEKSSFQHYDLKKGVWVYIKELSLNPRYRHLEINTPKRQALKLESFAIRSDPKGFDLQQLCYELISSTLLHLSKTYIDLDYKDIWNIFLRGYKSPVKVINSCSKEFLSS